jgi:hypothetical protein
MKMLSKRICLIMLVIALPFTACQRRIPPEFEYPPGWITEEHPLIQTRSLSGSVLDASGAVVQWVLVERMTPDFKKRLAATLTNERGEFRFHGGSGKYYLRFRYRACNDFLVQVVVTQASPETLVIKLENSD